MTAMVILKFIAFYGIKILNLMALKGTSSQYDLFAFISVCFNFDLVLKLMDSIRRKDRHQGLKIALDKR